MIYETITTTQIQFDFSHLFELGYSMSEILHDIELMDQGLPIEVEVEITVPVGQTAHDGIIPETRQTIGSNFAGNGTLDTKVALNTNHLEMVNSPEMTIIFDQIYNGQDVSPFFISPQ